MRRFFILCVIVLLTLSTAVVVTAQDTDTCSTFVDRALDELSSNCAGLSRNTACYGYNNVLATFFDDLMPSAFDQPDDRVDLATLQSITTAPLNVETSQWGIAILKVQANLPDTLPGQAVTFLLLGDVHLETGVEQDSDANPMQAVYFTTGIADTRCSEAPESSLIIQGPENITVNLNVNGANIALGSTAVFKSTAPDEMECGVLDGAATVGASGRVIKAGFAARVPLDENLNTAGGWEPNAVFAPEDAEQLQVLRRLPDGVLNYTPDVPTPEEVELLAVLEPGLVDALDSHLLRGMVHLLLLEGATPEAISGLDAPALRRFVITNLERLESADRAGFDGAFLLQLVNALDEYQESGGG